MMQDESKQTVQANIIGITGGIGCGKSTVTDLFKDRGVPIIDADVIAREVVLPDTFALQQITEKFSTSILLNDRTLNRPKLRDIIFKSNDHKHWLESLLHPLIRKQINSQLKAASLHYAYVVLSSPLLLETDQHSLVNKIVVIDINPDTQLSRAMLRDSNSKQQIQRIINAQMTRDKRNSHADFVLNNSQSLDELGLAVEQLHLKLCALFPSQ